MFKLIMGGIAGFIVIGLIGLNGVVKYKSESNAGEGLTKIVSLYKKSKWDAKEQIARSVSICTKRYADGNVPTYVNKMFVNSLTSSVKFLAKNGIDTMDDPRVGKFKKTMISSIRKQARVLDRRLRRESQKTQKRMENLLNQLQNGETKLAKCVGRNYRHRSYRKNNPVNS